MISTRLCKRIRCDRNSGPEIESTNTHTPCGRKPAVFQGSRRGCEPEIWFHHEEEQLVHAGRPLQYHHYVWLTCVWTVEVGRRAGAGTGGNDARLKREAKNYPEEQKDTISVTVSRLGATIGLNYFSRADLRCDAPCGGLSAVLPSERGGIVWCGRWCGGREIAIRIFAGGEAGGRAVRSWLGGSLILALRGGVIALLIPLGRGTS